MIRSDLLSRLTRLAPSTTFYAAHIAALAEAFLPAERSRQALGPVAEGQPQLDEAMLAKLTQTAPGTIEKWRAPDENQTVAPEGTHYRYRLPPVVEWIEVLATQEPAALERFATVFPMLDYADGAVENFLGSLDRTEPPIGFWLARIAKTLNDDESPQNQAFLEALSTDPDAALRSSALMSEKSLENFNSANWLMWELCRPSEKISDLNAVAEALTLLNDHDIGLGINAYGSADIVRHGLHTRISFTISHLVAGLTQSDPLLVRSLAGYATLVTTLIKLGADFSLEDEQGRHVLDVATQVRKSHVSSPFLNIIDKFLLVQQLDEILLHGDDENAEKI